MSTLFSGISSVLSVVATQLMPAIGKIIGPILEPFTKAIEAFMKSLGLIGNEEQVEEIGEAHHGGGAEDRAGQSRVVVS